MLVSNPPKVCVVAGYQAQKIATMFAVRGWVPTASVSQADLVCLVGGTDIQPSLYDEKPIGATQVPDPRRDIGELAIFKLARSLGKPLVGICRGAQLLNVLNGGKLWQDVDNHTGCFHAIKEVGMLGTEPLGWRSIISASDHHQQMIPGIKGNVIAVARRSTYWANAGDIIEINDGQQQWTDPEIVFYPEGRCLCYQPHPEDGKLPERNYFFELLFRFFGLTASSEPSYWRVPNTGTNARELDDDLSDLGGKDPVG